jgi:hypothetical protein
MQNRLASAGPWGLRERPGSGIQNRPSEHGPGGPCEWPVPAHGENHSGYLDDVSIKASTVRVRGQQPQHVLLHNANFRIKH